MCSDSPDQGCAPQGCLASSCSQVQPTDASLPVSKTKKVEATGCGPISETVAGLFWEEIICCHGNVATVISDRGGELSGSFEELLDRCFIDHCLTSPHHPQSNGLTERFSENLTIVLRRLVAHHPEDWAMHLSATLIGYRGSIQASIQFKSFHLLHGYALPLPVHALDPIPPPADGKLGQTAQALLQAFKANACCQHYSTYKH